MSDQQYTKQLIGDSYVHATGYDDAKLCLKTIMQAYESCTKATEAH